MKQLLLVGLFVGLMSFQMQAQEFHMPQASPDVTIHQNFSTSFIELKYSRPGVKGREVFGEMIPYGKLWRTGANSVTTIQFGEDVSLDGHPIKAGSYALYTIPGGKVWGIMINEGVHNWGTDGFNSKQNILKFTTPVHHLDESQESFSITLENLKNDAADLVLTWEKTKIIIPIKADNNDRILAHLDQELKGDKPPYFQAASYYLSTNQKLDKASELVDKAIAKDKKAYYMYWAKAQILEKLDRHDDALKAAKKAADLAKGTNAEFEYEYQQKYENLKQQK